MSTVWNEYKVYVLRADGSKRRIYMTPNHEAIRWSKKGTDGTFTLKQYNRLAVPWARRKGYKLAKLNVFERVRLKHGAHWPERRVVAKLNCAAKRLGKKVLFLISSGLRTFAEQKVLWDRWVAQGKPACCPVARPGTSRHESGDAADVGVLPNDTSLRDYPGGKRAAEACGLRFTVAAEAWHVEG